MQVLEYAQADAAHRMLGDAPEQRVADFTEQHIQQARHAVGNDQTDCRRQPVVAARTHGVDDVLEQEGSVDAADLGDPEAGKCQQDARAVLEQVWRDQADGAPAEPAHLGTVKAVSAHRVRFAATERHDCTQQVRPQAGSRTMLTGRVGEHGWHTRVTGRAM